MFFVNRLVKLVGGKMPLMSGCCQSLAMRAANCLQAGSLKG